MARSIWIVNFQRYNPPHKAVNADVRSGGPLKWVRMQVDWYRDEDVLDLPDQEQRLWPALVALAGSKIPPGQVRMSPAQLAREFHTTEDRMVHALRHLKVRGKIEYHHPTATQEVAG